VARCQIAEGRPAPEGEPSHKCGCGGPGIATGDGARCLGDKSLEPPEIDDAPLRAQPITARLRLDTVDTECSTQARNVDPDRVVRTGRRIVAPELVHEVVGRNGLADVQDEDREDRPLLGAADIHYAAWADDFEGAQNLELHSGNGCTHEAPADSNLWSRHEALTTE